MFMRRPSLQLPTLRAFDVADQLEGGFARESASEVLAPSPKRAGSSLTRAYVRMTNDEDYYMYLEQSDAFLLYARLSEDGTSISIHTYQPSDPLFSASQPAMTMQYQHDTWMVGLQQCENCVSSSPARACRGMDGHSQQLAYCTHAMQPLGNAKVHTLSINLPGLNPDGSRVIWCRRMGLPSLARPGASDPVLKVQTKLPEWNEERKTLCLEFKGRMVKSCSRNFQLCTETDDAAVVCQFGLTSHGDAEFILDYQFPMSHLQAFAAALSTVYWA